MKTSARVSSGGAHFGESQYFANAIYGNNIMIGKLQICSKDLYLKIIIINT